MPKPSISLIGLGASPEETTIAFPCEPESLDGSFSWGAVAEIQPRARGFMARNLTLENLTPDHNRTQGLAARSSADEAIYDNVRFIGYQDTLLVDATSRVYLRDCFITGDTDFIFGDATAVFDHCTIESSDSGYVTAANTKRTTANGLVFLDCTLSPGRDQNAATSDGSSATTSSVYLGRPWGWYLADQMPSTIFIRTRMGPHIRGSGWDPWDQTGVAGADRDPRTRYSEFASTDLYGRSFSDSDGNGTPGTRVSWADPLTAAQAANYTIDRIFGPAEF